MGVLGVPCGTGGALAGVLEIFLFRPPVEWVRAVLPRGSCLFWGPRVSFALGLLGACGSLCRR